MSNTDDVPDLSADQWSMVASLTEAGIGVCCNRNQRTALDVCDGDVALATTLQDWAYERLGCEMIADHNDTPHYWRERYLDKVVEATFAGIPLVTEEQS
jgi:hypothetical protein